MKRRDFAIGFGAAGLNALGGAARPAVPSRDDFPTALGRGDREGARRAWTEAASGSPKAIGQSDALLIVHNGRLVLERYGGDHGPTTRHIAWSMTKSVTHALAGVAVKQGRIDIDRPLRVVARPDPKLNLRALLTLTDGLKWDEGDYDPANSDATRMLYGPGRLDGAAYAAARPQAFLPGTRWNYSTGAFQLAAAELQANLFPAARTPDARRADMSAWMRQSLFDPIGMISATPEFDAAGTFVGGSFLYATARDFARFGELYRLDGVWKGRRILPEAWVRFARTPTVEPTYGAGFWLEAKAGAKPPSLMGGAGPADAYSAQGHNGQVILIVPSKAAVIVRLGLMDDGDAAWKALGEWLTPMVNALQDAKSA
ncbi:MAG: serine hydrolase domain-containing protein [Caulobacteraceae bacterium]